MHARYNNGGAERGPETAFDEHQIDHLKISIKFLQDSVPCKPNQPVFFLTKLTQGVFSVTNNDSVRIFLFACEVFERLQGHVAISLQDLERLLTVTPCIGSRSIKEPEKNGFTYPLVPW